MDEAAAQAAILSNPALAGLARAPAGTRSSLIDYGPGGLVMIYSPNGTDGGEVYVSSSEEEEDEDEDGKAKSPSEGNRSKNRFSSLNFKEFFSRRQSVKSSISLTASSVSAESVLPDPKRRSSTFGRNPSSGQSADAILTPSNRKSSVFSKQSPLLESKGSGIAKSPMFSGVPSSSTSADYVRAPSSADVDSVYTKSDAEEFIVTNPTDRRASGQRVQEHIEAQARRATQGPQNAAKDIIKLGLPKPELEAERVKRRLSERRGSKAVRRRSSVPLPLAGTQAYLIPEETEESARPPPTSTPPQQPQPPPSPSNRSAKEQPPLPPRKSTLAQQASHSPSVAAGAQAPPKQALLGLIPPSSPSVASDATSRTDGSRPTNNSPPFSSVPTASAPTSPLVQPSLSNGTGKPQRPPAPLPGSSEALEAERLVRVEAERKRQVERGQTGRMLKKTKKGNFHERDFVLKGTELSWIKSDGKTRIVVDVRGSRVVDELFGAKKFGFQVVLANDTLIVAAPGEAEKSAWMKAIQAASSEPLTGPSPMGRKSTKNVLTPPKLRIGPSALQTTSSSPQQNGAANGNHEALPPMSPLVGEAPSSGTPKVGGENKRASVQGSKRSSLMAAAHLSGRRTSTKDSPIEVDKMVSPLTFRVVFGTKGTLWVHAATQTEMDHWISVLLNAAKVQTLRKEVEIAKHKTAKADATARLESFLSRNPPVTYNGYLEKLSLNLSQRNWKRRYFILAHGTHLSYYDSDAMKKEKHVFLVGDDTAVFVASERRFLREEEHQ